MNFVSTIILTILSINNFTDDARGINISVKIKYIFVHFYYIEYHHTFPDKTFKSCAIGKPISSLLSLK